MHIWKYYTRHTLRISSICLCVCCVGPSAASCWPLCAALCVVVRFCAALCVGRPAASCWPLSVPVSSDIHPLHVVRVNPTTSITYINIYVYILNIHTEIHIDNHFYFSRQVARTVVAPPSSVVECWVFVGGVRLGVWGVVLVVCVCVDVGCVVLCRGVCVCGVLIFLPATDRASCSSHSPSATTPITYMNICIYILNIQTYPYTQTVYKTKSTGAHTHSETDLRGGGSRASKDQEALRPSVL